MNATTKALVEQALVGLDRSSRRPLPPGADGELVERLALPSPERSFLLRAGVAAVRARAGRLPRQVRAPAASPSEPRPLCSDALASMLAELLAEGPRGLLLEALQRTEARGLRVPPRLLPALLAAKDERLLPQAAAVAGERGRWLAAFNPDWQWLRRAPQSGLPRAEMRRLWEEGSLTDREVVLRGLRAEDAAEARAWLENVWKDEKAEVRERLLGVLGVGLGEGDGAFLERILSDRAASVRATAVRLLVRLPGSALAKRMVERANGVLGFTAAARGGLGGMVKALKAKLGGGDLPGTLVVAPPEAFGESWAADGLCAKPPAGVGERAFWMKQLLALVPPRHWEERFGVEPVRLIAMAAKTEWGEVLISGWTDAAVLFAAKAWAMPLWNGIQKTPETLGSAWSLSEAVLGLMSPDELEAVGCQMLAEGAPSVLNALAPRLPRPWGPALTAAFLASWGRARVSPTGEAALHGAQLLPSAAEALPGSAFAAALAAGPPAPAEGGSPGPLSVAFQRFCQVLVTRQRIHEETKP
jgi:hypothetical protein